jgi:hypothetical protein
MYSSNYLLLLLFLVFTNMLSGQTAKSIPIQSLNMESAVYLKALDRIYATIEDDYTAQANSILIVDPVRGIIEKTLKLGYRPRFICASFDEQFLYFISDGPQTLTRIRSSTNQVDLEVRIPGNQQVVGLKAVPGMAQGVILTSTSVQRDTTFIELIVGSSIKKERIVASASEYIIDFDFANDSTLIAWRANDLIKIRVNNNGLNVFQTLSGVNFDFGDQGIVTKTRVVTRTGKVINHTQAKLFVESTIDPYFFLFSDDYYSDVFYAMKPFGYPDEKKISFTRFKKEDVSIEASWDANFPQRFDNSYSSENKLYITGKDRLMFKYGGFSNIVWNCTSLLQAPTISPSGNVNYCFNENGVVLSVDKADAPEILWSDGNTGPQLRAKDYGTFTAKYTDAKGCQTPSSAPVNVSAFAPTDVYTISSEIGSGFSFTICKNAKINLKATSYYENAKKWIWSNGDTTQTSSVGAGTYTVKMISTDGCEGNWSSVIKVIEGKDSIPPRPVIKFLNDDKEICNGETAIFETTPGYKTYTWSRSSELGYRNSISHTTNINYTTTVTVQVANVEACPSEWAIPAEINFYAAPVKPSISLQGNKIVSNNPSSIHQWYLNDVLIKDATGSSIPLQGGGFYAAKVFDGRCSSEFSNLIPISGKVTATDDLGLGQGLNIYPNPVQDVLHINLPEALRNQPLVVHVSSMDGKQLRLDTPPTLQPDGIRLPTHGLAKGMYWLDIRIGTDRFKYKFVKI